MENNTFRVSCTIDECEHLIHRAVVEGSITGECIDRYEAPGSEGRRCVVLVFEKHYWRAGNRLTLTAVLDDLSGATRVHLVGGGGGEGLFRFDWGAANSFAGAAADALRPYLI